MLCTHLLQWAWKDLGGFQIWLSVINHSSFLQQWPRLIWLSLKYDFICLMNCRVTDPCYFIHQLIMLLYTAANHEQHSTFVSTREIPTVHSKGTLPCHHPYSRLLPFGKGSLWIRFFFTGDCNFLVSFAYAWRVSPCIGPPHRLTVSSKI